MSRWARALSGFAALSGAAGVAEAAASAHLTADPLLKTSADFLIVNAAAVIALSAVAAAVAPRKSWVLSAASILFVGGLLFCAELSAHALSGQRFVSLAAPVGGTLMIAGWLLAAIACFAGGLERRSP